MRGLVGVLFAVAAFSQPETSQRKSVFECRDSDNARIEVVSQDKKLRFQLFDKAGKLQKDTVLSKHWSFFDENRSPIDYRFALPEVEIRSQLERKVPQYYRVAFILQGQVVKDLKCNPYELGIPIRVVSAPDELIRSDELWLTRAARGFQTAESLNEESLEMWKAVVKRFALMRNQIPDKEWQGLVQKTFARVRLISPGASQQIGENLDPESRKCWNEILKAFQFEKLSPVDRWIWWIGLGNQGNLEAVRSAIREFFQSGLFKDPTLEKYFSDNSQADLKKISKKQRDQILKVGLDAREKAYFSQIWEKAHR